MNRKQRKAAKLAAKHALKSDKSDTLYARTEEKTQTKIEQNIAENKSAIINALHETCGVVTKACEIAGVSRDTYYRYLGEDPDFAAKVKEVDRSAADEAREVLRDIMLYSDHDPSRVAAAKTILAAKDKEGGFGVERREQSGRIDINATIQDVRFELPENHTGPGSDSPLPPGWETAAGGSLSS